MGAPSNGVGGDWRTRLLWILVSVALSGIGLPTLTWTVGTLMKVPLLEDRLERIEKKIDWLVEHPRK